MPGAQAKELLTKEASGASNLRSQVSLTATQSDRDPVELDKHAKKRSYIRMIVAFLSEGGLSLNAAAYHRSACCFRYFGNSQHTPDSPEVTLHEFQGCSKVRHTLGCRGNELVSDGISAVDAMA